MSNTPETAESKNESRPGRVKSALLWALLIVAAVFPFPWWP